MTPGHNANETLPRLRQKPTGEFSRLFLLHRLRRFGLQRAVVEGSRRAAVDKECRARDEPGALRQGKR